MTPECAWPVRKIGIPFPRFLQNAHIRSSRRFGKTFQAILARPRRPEVVRHFRLGSAAKPSTPGLPWPLPPRVGAEFHPGARPSALIVFFSFGFLKCARDFCDGLETIRVLDRASPLPSCSSAGTALLSGRRTKAGGFGPPMLGPRPSKFQTFGAFFPLLIPSAHRAVGRCLGHRLR